MCESTKWFAGTDLWWFATSETSVAVGGLLSNDCLFCCSCSVLGGGQEEPGNPEPNLKAAEKRQTQKRRQPGQNKETHCDSKEQGHWGSIEDIRERRPCDPSASETGNRTQKVAGSIYRKHNRTRNNNRISPKNLPSLSFFSANSMHDGWRCWATTPALAVAVIQDGPRDMGAIYSL